MIVMEFQFFFGSDNENDSNGGASPNESVVGSEADWLEPSEHSSILGIPSAMVLNVT